MRRKIRGLAEEKPDLQHALPILDLPVSTAFALSMLVAPPIYAQAPRLIHAIMGAVTLIPAAVILRRLLDRHSYPILNAIVIMYFVGQLRILAASLPVLARFIFLGQVLGATVFLIWVLRRNHALPRDSDAPRRPPTHGPSPAAIPPVYAAAAPASVPPSDADLFDVQRPHRRIDSADFRPRKQKESRGLPTPVTQIGP